MNRIGSILEDIGQVVRTNMAIVVIVVVAVGLLAAMMVSQPANSNSIEVVVQTIDAASTNSTANAIAPTIIANLSRTPDPAALTSAAPTIELLGRQEITQFAASAFASSERGDLEQSALQAVGPPNTDECADAPTAYASELPNESAVLTVFFPQLVTPTGIIVHESFNPGFISRIEFTDNYGEIHVAYENNILALRAFCPNTLIVAILDAEYQSNTITIYLEQATSAGGWNQIDAVELIGIRFN